MRSKNTHDLMKGILKFAQLFGLFPIDNIIGSNPNVIKFKWMSGKLFYSIILGSCTMFCGVAALSKAFTYPSMLNQLIPPLFYIYASFTTFIFICIAKKWTAFIQSLCKLEEEALDKYDVPIDLERRLRVTAIILYIPALCEHSLAVVNYVYSNTCENNATGWEFYFRQQFHFIFYFFHYSHVLGVLFMTVGWLGSLIWNFGDVFIISLSIIISTRFRQISNALELCLSIHEYNSTSHLKFKCIRPIVDGTLFEQIRKDYNSLALICKNLNQLLSNLIIICYVLNLSFILVQLFNSIRQMETYIERIYFFCSFGFVILRIIVVSIYAASINEESRYFLPVLNAAPTKLYCVEIHRLIMQIHADSSALTGHNFFRITRAMVLKIAAAIITYELVLIQFNQDTMEKYKSANTTSCF